MPRLSDPRKARSARFAMRVRPREHELLAEAADTEAMSVSEFMRTVAIAQAKRIIRENAAQDGQVAILS